MSGRKGKIVGTAAAVLLAGALTAHAQDRGTAKAPAAAAKPPAIVNGQVITWAELEATLRQAGPTPVQLPEADRKQARMQALAFLIDQALMGQFLDKNAKPISAAEVDHKLAEMEAGLRKQGKTIQDLCRETNQQEANLKTIIARNLQWYTYARSQLTDAQLDNYYRENKDLFDRTTVRVSHILLGLPATANETERAAARARLNDLRAQILGGKITFADAAKANSQGPTADKGGDLGFIPRKWVVEEAFAKMAFAMPVGNLSEIVETEFGLHLILVTDRKAGTPSDFAKIKEDVVQVCIEDMYMNVLNQLRKTAKVEINLP
jgi:parvulin-like peptidyl-prolyl isomerase